MSHILVATRPQPRSLQRGAVLFVALVFLILLALIAIAASGTSIMQERMTGGMRNSHLGLMGSESALRYVESYLWKLPGRTVGGIKFACGPEGKVGEGAEVGCFRRTYGVISAKVPRFRSEQSLDAVPDANRFPYKLTGLADKEKSASLAAQPRYIVEEVARYRPPGMPRGLRTGSQLGVTQGQGGAGDVENLYQYRITARSYGGNETVHRATESTFLAMLPVGFNPGSAP